MAVVSSTPSSDGPQGPAGTRGHRGSPTALHATALCDDLERAPCVRSSASCGPPSPGPVSGDQARRLVDLFAQAERAAASGIALVLPGGRGHRLVRQGGPRLGGRLAGGGLGLVGDSGQGPPGRRRAGGGRPGPHRGAPGGRPLGGPAQVGERDGGCRRGGSVPQDLLELVAEGASHHELADAAARLRAAARQRETEHARRARVHAVPSPALAPASKEAGSAASSSATRWPGPGSPPASRSEAAGRWKAAGGTTDDEPRSPPARRLPRASRRGCRHGPGNRAEPPGSAGPGPTPW